jgi:hypothetical protein
MSSSSDEKLNRAQYAEIPKTTNSDEDAPPPPPVKTRFEKIAEHNPLIAESNETFVKKAGEIVQRAHILQDLLDKIYQSAKNAINMI